MGVTRPRWTASGFSITKVSSVAIVSYCACTAADRHGHVRMSAGAFRWTSSQVKQEIIRILKYVPTVRNASTPACLQAGAAIRQRRQAPAPTAPAHVWAITFLKGGSDSQISPASLSAG